MGNDLDVLLAVLDDLIADMGDTPGTTGHQVAQARAAVAELVAEARTPAVAYGCLYHTGIHFVSDDRDDCVEESRRDGSLVVELIVRPFALARVGGAK